MWKRHGTITLAFLVAGCLTAFAETGEISSMEISIGPFDSGDAEKHQQWIQEKIDDGGEAVVFRFAPGDYLLSDPRGIRIPDSATILMTGTRFQFVENISEDGQAFLLVNPSNVTFRGGEITGHRDKWDPGVNVAGIRVRGTGKNLIVADLTCRNLSSNAVAVFGKSEDEPFHNVTLTHVTGINCCNFYGDYLSDKKGPAPGSDRKDQGTVALYHVDGWLVDGCRFEKSQSDGTHFFHSHNGRFVNSVVSESQMGGYFLEGCRNVIATGNLISRNGSRGVTIERDSRQCILADNIIEFSGREGAWMPDVSSIIVSGNIFRRNGRKDDTDRDCEIRIDDGDSYETVTENIRIENNLLETDPHQTAAVYIAEGIQEISLENNTFTGKAPGRNSL